MKKYYLWLIMCFGAGSKDINELLSRFGTPEGVYDAFRENRSGAGRELNEKAEKYSLIDAEKLLSELNMSGVTAVSIADSLYPETLKTTENPPCMLFVRGNAGLLRNKLLTVVGARKITPYTQSVQGKICDELIKEYTLVTTLSEGCDQLSAIASLCGGKPFIEILPCSFHNEYPRNSSILRDENIRRGGCSVTEYVSNTPPIAGTFIKRGRILGGISPATLVFQAGRGSGALRTASFSKAPYFIPPNDVFSPEYAGAVSCIRRGGLLYLSCDDLKAAYSDNFTAVTLTPEEKKPAAHKCEKITQKTEKAPSEKTENIRLSEESFETELHYKIYSVISSEDKPIPFDVILHKTGVELADLSEILLDLEIEGIINALPGNKFGLKATPHN